jgi:hypothetical protein
VCHLFRWIIFCFQEKFCEIKRDKAKLCLFLFLKNYFFSTLPVSVFIRIFFEFALYFAVISKILPVFHPAKHPERLKLFFSKIRVVFVEVPDEVRVGL